MKNNNRSSTVDILEDLTLFNLSGSFFKVLALKTNKQNPKENRAFAVSLSVQKTKISTLGSIPGFGQNAE